MARSAVPPKRELGAFGEQLAAEELERAGMPILDRNWTSRYGEIDIVAREGTTLVIVEVKTRRSVRYGTPLEAVPDRKVRRLRRLTGLWRQAHADILGWVRDVRIDVMGVRYFDDRPPVIEHVRGVS